MALINYEKKGPIKPLEGAPLKGLGRSGETKRASPSPSSKSD